MQNAECRMNAERHSSILHSSFCIHPSQPPTFKTIGARMPTYATQSDIEDLFGPANVAAWSRFENPPPGGAADAARIAAALAHADAQINAFFTGGPYALPLVCSTCRPVVTHWAAVIAGVWLYGSRASVSYVDYS